MHSIALLSSVLAVLATTVSARNCHIYTYVSYDQPTPCARCPPGPAILRGTATLDIDGTRAWTENGSNDQYETLSNGPGYYVDADGVIAQVASLGIPALTQTPRCEVKLGEYVNIGTGRGWSDGGIGGLSNHLECHHDFLC